MVYPWCSTFTSTLCWSWKPWRRSSARCRFCPSSPSSAQQLQPWYRHPRSFQCLCSSLHLPQFIGHVDMQVFCVARVPQVTTARKAVTLLLSYLIFTKPLTEQHGTGLLLIAMGILLKLLPENKDPASHRREQPHHHPRAQPAKLKLRSADDVDEEKRPSV